MSEALVSRFSLVLTPFFVVTSQGVNFSKDLHKFLQILTVFLSQRLPFSYYFQRTKASLVEKVKKFWLAFSDIPIIMIMT